MDIGAGSGYWAHLLADYFGCTVVACDDLSDGLEVRYFPVEKSDADSLLSSHPGVYDNYTILYLWPRSYPGLHHWKGNRIIMLGDVNVRSRHLQPLLSSCTYSCSTVRIY